MGATATPSRVLIVEDDPSLRRGLRLVLGARFASVESCGTLAEARELLGAFQPELVLMDLYLPDGDGFALAREALRGKAAPAVVAMSGSANESDFAALERSGVHVRLRKPLTARRLDDAITRALELRALAAAPR
jgi:two-component system CitB family response regulator